MRDTPKSELDCLNARVNSNTHHIELLVMLADLTNDLLEDQDIAASMSLLLEASLVLIVDLFGVHFGLEILLKQTKHIHMVLA